MKRFCFSLLLCLLGFGASALPPGNKPAKPAVHKAPAVLKTDTASNVDVRAFSADSLKKFSSQPEFNYNERQIDMGWWARFWRWFWHLFQGKKQTSKKMTGFWQIFLKVLQYILVGLGVGAIILIILKIMGVDITGAFKRRSKSVALPYSEYLEDINAIDFDKEVDAAISQHNYRLAVRLLYLKCLKKLSDAGLIDWQISKTNTSYINELKDTEKRSMFGVLTRRFEYVWYGEFDIDKQIYTDIQAEFSHFNSSIK